MSTNPYWIPVVSPALNELPYEIKYPLSRKYQDHDGSLSGETELGPEDIPYLEGLRDAGNPNIKKGAQILIDAIEKHERILFIIQG